MKECALEQKKRHAKSRVLLVLYYSRTEAIFCDMHSKVFGGFRPTVISSYFRFR